jgi:carbonic anhydrase
MTLAVLGLIFKLIDENSTVSTIFDNVDFTASSFAVNFNTTIGSIIQNQNVFHYTGSLTTPTCNEIVNWFVSQTIYPIRPSHLEAIQAQLNDGEANSRPVQDINQRSVYYITPNCNANFTFEVIKQMMLSGSRMSWLIML